MKTNETKGSLMKRILKFIGCLALGCVGLTSLADTVAKIEGKGEYETFAAAVAAADTGDRIEIVKAGEYKLGTISKNVTVSGAVDNVAFNCYDARKAGSAPQGATFENVWFKFGNFGDGEGDQGIWDAGPLTFNGCKFSGKFWGYSELYFNNCVFNQDQSDMYCLWTYGSKKCVFDGCTFNCTGKAVNVYNVGDPQVSIVIARNCTFNATEKNKSAFQINASHASSFTVIVDEGTCELKGDFVDLGFANIKSVPEKTVVAVGKDIVLDENDKIVSGDFSRYEAGATAQNPISPQSMVSVDPQTGKAVVKEDPIKGKGTEADPFVIKDLECLQLFRDRVNAGNTYAGKFFVLDADIDLNNENWEPIGTATHPYAGNGFDGQNHTISNLYIHGVDLVSQGLFGKVTHDQNKPAYPFKNLTIVNVDIDLVAKDVETCGAAALIGEEFADSEVVNVKVTGSISIKAAKWAGGIVGWGLLQYTDCTVEDTTEDGGVIAAGYAVGGITGGQGYYSVKGGKVTNCSVSNVTVLGDQRVGGLVGINNNGNHDYMNNTVQKVKLAENPDFGYSVMYTTFGKLLGCDNEQDANMPTRAINNDVKEDTCVIPEGVMNIGGDRYGVKYPAAMAIVGWNVTYDNQKKIIGGTFEQLPTGVLGEGCVMDIDPTGKIVVLGPLVPDDQGVYHIATMQDLKVFRLMVNGGNTFGGKTVVLDADIDFVGEWDSGIGDGDHKFMGMFDGQGYKITGLKISAADKDTIGLFGFVDEFGAEVWNSWVKNLVLDGAQIVGKENVGGIVGYVHRGIIENCTITNSTISGTVKVGSVAGMMYPGRCIGNTIVATTVSGTSHIGGVAGQMVGGSVSGNVLGGDDAASKVTVTATAKKDECGAGGLVGAVSCSDGGKNYVNDNTIKCAEAITDGVTAPIPFCDFRKNLFSKDESKVEIKRNMWPTVDPNADYYDMVDFASTKEPKDYLRVNNFHPVAEIAGKGLEYRYETVKKALQDAATFPGTVEDPTVVQLYPGVVSADSFTVENFELNNVVVQGSANFASILKDTAIQSDGSKSIVWKGVTFKGILWDNSHLRASVFGFEDLAFIGNKFVNLVGSESAVHFTLQGPMCKNLTFVGNVFEGGESGTAAAINCASAAIKCLTGEITITNNVFKSAPWRAFCVRVDANDGIADKVVVTDNWFEGNDNDCDWINVQGNTDNVIVRYQYNIKDDPKIDSLTINGVSGANAKVVADHNYFARNPDAAPDAFYVNTTRTEGNIYDAGVYPYYNAYHKDELAAGTTTVRDSLYNLVDPAAIVVNEDGKFVKMTIADAMAASKPGESVMLIRDATDEEVVIAGDVTFDKNGKNCGKIKAAEGYLLVDLGGGKYIAKSPVAEIVDGQKYDTLEKAVAAVTTAGQTIRMLANETLTKELSIGADKSFTLDLNGKTIKNAETGFEFTRTNVALWDGVPKNFMIIVEGSITIRDSSEGKAGEIVVSNYGDTYYRNKALLIIKNGMVKLEGGKVYGEYAGCYLVGDTSLAQGETPVVPTLIVNGGELAGKSYGVAIKGATAELEVNGGKVTAPDITAISTNGTQDWYNGGNCKITINGGLVESENGAAMYNPAESVVKIMGGTLKGESAVIVKGGKVEISGDAELIAYGDKHTPEESVAGTVDDIGDALYIEDTYENHKPIVSVIGGMLKSANGHAVQYWTNKSPSAEDLGGLTIAGGTLVAAKDEAAVLVGGSVGPVKFIEAQVDEVGTETGYPLFNSRIIPQYIAEGYIEKDNGNGTWTVTKGQAEIEVVIKPVEPTTKMVEGMTEEEKTEGKKQAEQIKENIVAALSDPSISDIVGTGIIEATHDTDGKLRDYVVNALKDAATTQALKDQITPTTDVKSHVEITFESLEVKVAIDESEQRVVKSTLNKVKYEIKPILTTYITVGDVTTKIQTRIPSDQILANPIEFALCLEPSFVSEMAKVTHLKADDTTEIDTKTYPVKRDGAKAYIELAWNQFSFAEIEGQSVEDQVCTVNGAMYDSVATAAAAADDGAVITLLKDIPSNVAAVPLKPLQVIELNGKKFEAPLEGVAAGYELAKTPEDQAFIAPKKIEVPTTGEPGAPKIKVRIAGMTADQLKEIRSSGRPRWADIVMGTDQKLIPFVPRSPIGIGTVTIRTTLPDSTFVRTAATARDGVSVKYQLKKRVGNGDFLEYGEVKEIPVFTVDAAALETRTSWKIETIFDEEY